MEALPVELHFAVAAYLDGHDLRSLRLVSRQVCVVYSACFGAIAVDCRENYDEFCTAVQWGSGLSLLLHVERIHILADSCTMGVVDKLGRYRVSLTLEWDGEPLPAVGANVEVHLVVQSPHGPAWGISPPVASVTVYSETLDGCAKLTGLSTTAVFEISHTTSDEMTRFLEQCQSKKLTLRVHTLGPLRAYNVKSREKDVVLDLLHSPLRDLSVYVSRMIRRRFTVYNSALERITIDASLTLCGERYCTKLETSSKVKQTYIKSSVEPHAPHN